jgi:hypothetical protein
MLNNFSASLKQVFQKAGSRRLVKIFPERNQGCFHAELLYDNREIRGSVP